MANIDAYLRDIQNATYGEEVRGSIHDAIEAINDESSEAISLSTSADIKADTALENSAEAISTSESADSKATDAVTFAHEAYDTANEALSKIENARITRYGVRFGGSANSGATVRRTYDAVGLVAGVGTDTETAVNDFDDIYPWAGRRRCCGTWDNAGHFTVNAYEGEPGYTTDGSNGEVWVETPLFYYDHKYDGDAEEITISTYPISGFKPSPIHINKDGSLRQKAYTAAYPMSIVDDKPTSRSGTEEPEKLNAMQFMNTARTLGEHYSVTTIAEWYVRCLLMWVEFGTRDIQSVMRGCCNLNENAKAVIAEENANRIIINSGFKSYFGMGVRIKIKNSAIRNILSMETYETNSGGTEVKTALYFDGDPIDIAVNDSVIGISWLTGSCDNVLASSGSHYSNTDGLHTCIYRGEESPFGNTTECIGDIIYKLEDNSYSIYFLNDMSKYSNFNVTDDYIRINYKPVLNYGWTKKLGYDERFPFIRLPVTVGGSKTTYYADYKDSISIGLAKLGITVGGHRTALNDHAGPTNFGICDVSYNSYSYSLGARLSYQY